MRILSRYFLVSYLTLFVTVLFAATVAIVVVEMLLNFDEVLDRERGLPAIATHLFVRLPSTYLHDLIPVASFAAAFTCTALAARGHEITALKAGGISVRRSVLPLLLGAAALSLVALIVNETLVLHASRIWSRLERVDEQVVFRQGWFWYHRDSVTYSIRDADRETRTLHGVSIFELTSRGRLRRSIRADRVRITDDDRWHLFEATLRTFDPEDPRAPPVTEHAKKTIFEVANERDQTLLGASASSLSLRNLRHYIEARQREGHDTSRYRALLHARLAQPLTVLLFAWIAIPLGMAVSKERSLARCALQGVVIVAVFYAIRSAVSMFAAGGYPAATLGPWAVLTLFTGFGAWRFARVPA